MSSTYIKVCIVPNAKEFKIESFNWNKELKIYVKSKAENFSANNELLKELKKLLKTEIEIVKGKTSKHKLLRIDEPEKIVLEKLTN